MALSIHVLESLPVGTKVSVHRYPPTEFVFKTVGQSVGADGLLLRRGRMDDGSGIPNSGRRVRTSLSMTINQLQRTVEFDASIVRIIMIPTLCPQQVQSLMPVLKQTNGEHCPLRRNGRSMA